MIRVRDDARRMRMVAAIGCLALLLAMLPFVAQAATLFSDDFEDGNATGWSTNGGSWSVVSDGSLAYRQNSTGANSRSTTGSTSWTDQSVQARVKPLAFNGADRYVGVIARFQSSSNYYALALRNGNSLALIRVASGSSTVLASKSFTVTPGTWYTLRLDTRGATLTATVNGVQQLAATDSQFASGKIGLAGYFASGVFDDVSVTDTPVGITPTPVTPSPTPITGTPTTPLPGDSPIGFASVNALGQNGTTGGAGGPVVTVTTAEQLIDYIARPGPYVIRVSGTINLPAGAAGGMYNVSSDKTIIGVGATATIIGGGFNIGGPVSSATTPPPDAIHNVIIRNLSFRSALDDAINVQMFAHHVWIDHNDLTGAHDGLIDIKRGADYITVSWNNTHNHAKNMLLGHDDNNGPQDIGRLKVTYHHNWFNLTSQRNPRVRFAEPVHVFNNYFIRNSDYGVASAENAGVVVEGNYFQDVEEPVVVNKFGAGRAIERNNVYAGESGAPETRGPVVEPSTYYSYTLDPAANIPSIVMNGAGVGKISS